MTILPVQAGKISADNLHRDHLGMLHAEGDVYLEVDELSIQARRLDIDMDTKSGDMYDATVHFRSGQTLKGAYLKRIDLTRFNGDNILYSSCPEDDMAWQLRAKHATLDQDNGTFVAQNAWFSLAGIPVLYAPRWQHALSRRSGFLMPMLEQGSRRGVEISLPLYWAASPNWDMTLTPRWMDQRGLMGEVEWRHRSALGAELLQLQSVFDSQTQAQRSRVQSNMSWVFTPFWKANINADWVSDGLFVADFPKLGELESLAYVRSNAAINWANGGQTATLGAQYQQRLGNVSNAATLQILPRLQTAHNIHFEDGKLLSIQQQTTLFRRDIGVSGWRVGIKPEWQQPWSWFGGAVAAKWAVAGQYVGYEANQQQVGITTPAYTALASSLEMEVAVERFSADKQWRHEIKPMLRLDISSAQNQDRIPLYDSGLAPLGISNLMLGNRYSGWDRFERMQRLSMLITSSLQHKSEQDKSRTVLQAQLGLAWDGLQDNAAVTSQNKQQIVRSNLLAELAWLPFQAWRFAVGGQHDPTLSSWVETHASMGWSGAAGSYMRVSWQRTGPSHSVAAESLVVATKWHVNRRWSTHLRSQYDVFRAQMLQASAGIAYVHPCWDVSLETFQSYLIGSERLSDVGVRLLLAFDGLGSIGD